MSTPQLSRRGTAHAESVTPFWNVFDRILSDTYDAEGNPQGIINMAIANNSLMSQDLLQHMRTNYALNAADLTYGTSLFGSSRLFAALCKLYNSDYYRPHEPVEPEHIITGPGCGSLLDQLAEHLADPGECFLTAAPLYNGFDADLGTRSQVKCRAVFSPQHDEILSSSFRGDGALRGFEQTYQQCALSGSPARAIMVTNPHNPLGRCYDRDALLACGAFAQSHNLFLVVDEIYALSVFPTSDEPSPQPFISALSIDWAREGVDPQRLVVLSSASKDWGSNGLRVGTLVTRNKTLRNALKVTAKLNMVASPADCLWSAILTDEKFFQWYVQTNRLRLSAAYETVKTWCLSLGLEYAASNAGHFLMVNLAHYLPSRGTVEDRETQLWSQCLEHGVAITPGFNYHHPSPGWFRITFALEPAVLREGLQRIQDALDCVNLERQLPPSHVAGLAAVTGGCALPTIRIATGEVAAAMC